MLYLLPSASATTSTSTAVSYYTNNVSIVTNTSTGASTTIQYIRVGNSISPTSSTISTLVTNTSLFTTSSTGITSYYDYNYNKAKAVIVKPNRKKLKLETNLAKKALWKSILLFKNLFGEEKIKLFLNGQAFEIEGYRFNYRISRNKYTGMLEHTKDPWSMCIPYVLEIFSKSNVLLGRGCTVFKNTPVIDQITALLLHIQAGEEEHLLKNMNLNSLTDDFYRDAETIDYINSLKGTAYKPKLLGI